MSTLDVTALDLRDYAISYGWELVKEALNDGLYVLNSPRHDDSQLIFPIDLAKDVRLTEVSLERLREFTGKKLFRILEEIREVNDDALSIRYFSETKSISSMLFSDALQTFEATKKLLLSAGSSVVAPSSFYPRLSRTEPNDLLKKTKFRHTEKGSFILNISCPLDFSATVTPSLFEDVSVPYTRSTFKLINQACFYIATAVSEGEQDEFIGKQLSSDTPIVSSNFCDALSELFDEQRELPLDIGFTWSRASLKKIPAPQLPHALHFPFEFKQRIEYIRDGLKPAKQEITDSFFGTVESLDGDNNNDGKREGPIRLRLYMPDGEINAKAVLLPDDYQIAIDAHRDTTLISIKGKLLPGKQSWVIKDISDFSLLRP